MSAFSFLALVEAVVAATDFAKEGGTALVAASFCFSIRATLSDAAKDCVTQLFLIVHPYF